MEQLNNLFMSQKQGNYQYTYVCRETLYFKICKKNKIQFAGFFSFLEGHLEKTPKTIIL